MRPLCARERERGCAQLVDKQPVEMALADRETSCETRDSLAIDNGVAEQPHRTADEIATRVPLGRAGDSVRTATLAGP